MVSIELTPFTRPTVRWFVSQYLFSKAKENGGRVRGEEYIAEIHRQWEQFCGGMKKPCGNIDSFRREVRKMKTVGAIEQSREEEVPGGGAMPRQYYVLSSDHYEAMVADSRKTRKK